jgi:hypothetical protein
MYVHVMLGSKNRNSILIGAREPVTATPVSENNIPLNIITKRRQQLLEIHANTVQSEVY